MIKRIKYIVLCILLGIAIPCFSQTNSSRLNTIDFSNEFNNQFNNANLLLACIVYSNKINRDSILTEHDKFVEIAGSFQSYMGSNVKDLLYKISSRTILLLPI